MPSGEPPAPPSAGEIPAPEWKRWILPWTLIVVGAFLRLAWPLDFEWKGDEKGIFKYGQDISTGKDPWPWYGGRSSVGLDNPGFSLWPFAGLAWVHATPDAMTFGIMFANVLALFGFALWVWIAWPPEERVWGLWAVALFAVSPLPVLFSRKLWAQDLLPVLLIPWLWSHSKRERSVHAFLWGFWGILLGQLHLSGFFAAVGLIAATGLMERKSVKWIPWLIGSAIGSLPLMPWFSHVLTTSPAPVAAGEKAVTLDLFCLLAFKHAWGIGLDYSLGAEMGAFLKGPSFGEFSTGLLRWVHLALLGIGLFAFINLWRERKSLVVPRPLGMHLWGMLIGIGLFQIGGAHLHQHYLIVWSPIFFLAAAWMLSRRPRWLAAAAILQLFVTACFLQYVHQHGGVAQGDFGITYRRQLEQPPPEQKE